MCLCVYEWESGYTPTQVTNGPYPVLYECMNVYNMHIQMHMLVHASKIAVMKMDESIDMLNSAL
jgi:hypothetical protein